MSYSLSILQRAKEDVNEIHAWLSRRSQQGAARWYDSLCETTTTLLHNPEGCGLAPESGILNQPIRQRFFKTRRGRTYRILFIVVDNEVRILRVRAPRQRLIRPEDIAP